MSSRFPDEYRQLLELLVTARKKAGITQQQLAARLGRHQSFVSKFESGERRLDVVEFVRVSEMIRADPHKMLRLLRG